MNLCKKRAMIICSRLGASATEIFRQATPLIAVLVLPLAFSGCHKEHAQVEDVRPVRTLTIGAPVNATGATYSGEIKARREDTLGFQIAGRIQQRLVEVDDSVAAGAPLMRLDPIDATLNAQAALAQVDSARARCAQLKADLIRNQALAEKSYVGKSQLEKAQLDLDTAEQSLKAAQASYRVAANQTGYTTLKASAAGVVTAIDVEVGRVVQAGQVVIHIAEHGERELVVSIPESRVDELRNARGLSIELWADSSKHYAGRLRELAPDTDSITRTYDARISVLEADAAIRLGMTARLTVDLATPEGFRKLPLTAIYDPDGTPRVWIVDPKTSRVAPRVVTLAKLQKNAALVSAGLADRDIVVTAGVNLLHDGQQVRVAESQMNGAPKPPPTK
jgi:RND family efflux transporter MFP subunit